MDSHDKHVHSSKLKKAVLGLLNETRYHCSVIRDFMLPSDYLIDDTKLPAIKKRGRTSSSSRSKRDKDKERKRKQRALQKHVELNPEDDPEKTPATRFQNLYKSSITYREKKLAYSRDKYSINLPFKTAKKLALKEKYKSNAQFKESRKDFIKNKYKSNSRFKQAQKDYINKKYKSNKRFQQEHKDSINKKYHSNILFKKARKDYIKNKYKSNISFRQSQRNYIKNKYKTDISFQQYQRNYIKNKYKSNISFQQYQKNYVKNKYSTDISFQQHQRNYINTKYKTDISFQQAQKEYSKKKYKLNNQFKLAVKKARAERYASDIDFKHKVKALNLLRYRQNVLVREKCKKRQLELYRRELQYREKKISLVQARRSNTGNNLAAWFRQQVRDGPIYICSVCIKLKFRKQVVQLDTGKYLKKGNQSAAVANRCITFEFKTPCTADCPIKCETINHKLWICYTCHRHLIKSEVPADARANGLELTPIPEELKYLNSLEKQLISQRIPFMKLVQLPKGNQRGIIGPCVSIPTDIQKTVAILPRSDDDSQLVRCKLKRKQSYIGYSQYAFISTKKICKALDCLKECNPYYKDTVLNQTWLDGFSPEFEDLTITAKDDEGSPDILEIRDIKTQQSDEDPQDEDDQDVKDRGFPSDTCLQPVDIGQEIMDQHFDDIFCVAPGEGSTPVSMIQEEGNEAMSFPAQFPEGSFGSYDSKRPVHLTRSRYFHARLFSGDRRFSSDSSYIFYAQYLSELEQVISKVSIALRKSTGKDSTGNAITASMLTDRNQLKSLLSTDQGYKFMTPIRGTPPYWQTALKDLLATVRQLGIPTWFATFSAADMRWTEVLQLLLEQQNCAQSLEDLDWTGKSEVLRNNPVMNAVMFDHRFHTYLKDIIIKRGIIGNVKDHFHRIEFQQRGSPHAHCLFWIEDAPVVDQDDDQTVCDFVDQYVSCQLPDKTVDPELHAMVSSVQQHSKNHSKSCHKKGTTCRFNFPRPPSEKTFISRRKSLADPSIKKSPQQMKDFAKSVLNQLWTVLQDEHLENITTQNLFQAAGITQQEFEDASNILTKRNSVTLQRSPSDVWINQYNPDLLRCWNANMDIQFITDVYACVVYIISYISKAEREMGVVLQNASKEAAEGNCDAQQAMKKISGAYFRQREVSAQEAVYRVCGLHLKECSRKVQFVPVGDNPIKMSLPLNVIKKKANQLDNNIWMPSLYDRYKARPAEIVFEKVCYASFCSQYYVLSASQIPKNPEKSQVFKLQNDLGSIKKRSRTDSAVIKYPRFSSEKFPELYFQSNLQLFLPHRTEGQLKPLQFKTYEEMYLNGAVLIPPETELQNVKSIVDANRQMFEKNAEALEEAEEMLLTDGPKEDAWALISPETEAERLEGQEDRKQINEEDSVEIPELDIATKKNQQGNGIEIRQTICPTPQIRTFMQQLNREQKDVFYRIRQWCIDKVNDKNPEPFRVFINGGAGTGKSHLIKCLFYEITKILSPYSANPDDIVVLLTAPTATAAFNIGGTTLHQAFSLPPNLPFPYIYLREDSVNKLRSKLQHLSILIIDEISMVGQRSLLYINERLRQIKQSGNALFGNICVIAVGDFYQLPPVKQKCLYDLRPESSFPLWSSNFSLVELKQVMRQKDDSVFAYLLNRLRVKRKDQFLSLQDKSFLKSCEQHTNPPETLHIFGTNKEVESHNNQLIEEVCKITQTICAQDYDKHPQTGRLALKEQPYDTSHDYLPAHLIVGQQARVMLIRNVDMTCGLVNGAMGTVTEVLPPKQGLSMPQGVMVLFDNERICQDKTSSRSKHQAIMITKFEENLPQKAVRFQFPLRLAWACTIHKVQGLTTDAAVVSLKNIFAPGMSYVALSRVTSMAGLTIKDFDEKNIYCNEQICKALKQMPLYLTVKDKPIHQNNMGIILHNIQGLIPHINDIRSNSDILSANFVCLTETWLKNETVPCLKGFNFLHKNRFSSYPSKKNVFKQLKRKKNGGVGIYIGHDQQCCPITLDSVNMECIVIFIKEINTNLVLIYRTETYPSSVFLDELYEVLFSLPQENENTSTIVLGDFNQDVLKKDSSIEQFMAKQGFSQVVSHPTTDGDTLIDHVYLYGNLQISTEIIQTYYSYHNMVSLNIKLPTM
ncbi:uncharacterized protein [Mytilus edulis]|uniref:uncharacterized protein n=1 Tax=Mytilus edulis TaxID=6550 RepID=UPI0039EF3B3F